MIEIMVGFPHQMVQLIRCSADVTHFEKGVSLMFKTGGFWNALLTVQTARETAIKHRRVSPASVADQSKECGPQQ